MLLLMYNDSLFDISGQHLQQGVPQGAEEPLKVGINGRLMAVVALGGCVEPGTLALTRILLMFLFPL